MGTGRLHAAITLNLAVCAFGASCLAHRSVTDQQVSSPGLSSRRLLDGEEWMLENLNVNIAQSYCYDDAEANCNRYGRLYTWQAAQRGCRSLGTGWRLPTDDEWRRMAKQYGGIDDESADSGRMAYRALLAGGSSGFNAVLGGGRDERQFARLGAHGFYWTASENDSANAVFYNFAHGGLALHRQDQGEKWRAFSVRCIRTAHHVATLRLSNAVMLDRVAWSGSPPRAAAFAIVALRPARPMADVNLTIIEYRLVPQVGQIRLTAGSVHDPATQKAMLADLASFDRQGIILVAGDTVRRFHRRESIGGHVVETALTVYPAVGHGYRGGLATAAVAVDVDGKRRVDVPYDAGLAELADLSIRPLDGMISIVGSYANKSVRGAIFLEGDQTIDTRWLLQNAR